MDWGNGFTQVLERARAAGLRTNLEMVTLPPERALALVRPCLPLLDTIVINELEAAALSEVATHRAGVPDFNRVEAAARRLVELGVSQLAVIHFPEGCVAAAPGGRASPATNRARAARRHPEQRISSASRKRTSRGLGTTAWLSSRWHRKR